MIKCKVTACGQITRAAQLRNNKEGKPFITFGLSVVIQAKNGINKTIEVSVAKDGGDPAEIINYPLNQRAEISGVLVLHKKGDNLYWNLSAEKVNVTTPGGADGIQGNLNFRGTVGKQVDAKTDKKGNPYITFSGYSCEKDAENFVYTWVRFRQFGTAQPEWLQPKSHIEALGEIELSVYNDRIDIGCVLQQLKPWVKQPYQPQN